MSTSRKTASARARPQLQASREGAVLVAAVGVIIAVLGHVATGVAIAAVAAVVFVLGMLGRPAAPPAAPPPAAPRPAAPRARPRRRR